MIRKPTRVSSSSATLIDHIWTNDLTVSQSGIIRYYTSDHFPVFISTKLNDSVLNLGAYETVVYRKFSVSNKCVFSDCLRSVDWSDVLQSPEVNVAYNAFHIKLYNLFNSCFPLCTRRKKKLDIFKPYINDEIKVLIKEKRRLMKLFSKWPITYAEQYKRSRNKVSNAVRAARRNYYRNSLNVNDCNPHRMWKTLNELMDRSPSVSTHPNELIVDGILISDPSDIANAFNNFFCNIGSVLSSIFTQSESDFTTYMPHDSDLNFSFEPINDNSLEVVVENMKNTGPGYDHIPMFIYKDNFHLLSKVMTYICDLSLLSGSFLDNLK